MSDLLTRDSDNDTQCELAAWELLKEAREERDKAIIKMNARVGLLLACLKSIINDLPQSRDWLNPDTEKVARELLSNLNNQYFND